MVVDDGRGEGAVAGLELGEVLPDGDELDAYTAGRPQLADRIFEYILSQDRFGEYLRLFNWLLNSGNSLYENVEAQWFESLLLSSPSTKIRPKLRRVAVEFVRGR